MATNRPYIVLVTNDGGASFRLVGNYEAPTVDRAREIGRDAHDNATPSSSAFVAVAASTFKVVGYAQKVTYEESLVDLPPSRPLDSNGNPPLEGQTDLVEAVEEPTPTASPQGSDDSPSAEPTPSPEGPGPATVPGDPTDGPSTADTARRLVAAEQARRAQSTDGFPQL